MQEQTRRGTRDAAHAFSAVLKGSVGLVRGTTIAIQYACSGSFWSDPRLFNRLLFTPALLLSVHGIALSLRTLTLPVIWCVQLVSKDVDPGYNMFVEFSAVLFLVVLRDLFPHMSSAASCFVDTLRWKSPSLAEAVERKAVLRGLRHKLQRWSLHGFGAATAFIGAIFLLHMLAPLIGVAVLAVSTALVGLAATLGPLVFVGVVLAALTLLSCSLSCANVLTLALRLYRLDPVIAALLLFCLLGGVVSASHLGQLVSVATELYYASVVLSRQLLAEYADRLPLEQWEGFKRRHCWELVGFGLPGYVAAKLVHPLVLVGSLQVLQAAAAELVVDDAELTGGTGSQGSGGDAGEEARSKAERNCCLEGKPVHWPRRHTV